MLAQSPSMDAPFFRGTFNALPGGTVHAPSYPSPWSSDLRFGWRTQYGDAGGAGAVSSGVTDYPGKGGYTYRVFADNSIVILRTPTSASTYIPVARGSTSYYAIACELGLPTCLTRGGSSAPVAAAPKSGINPQVATAALTGGTSVLTAALQAFGVKPAPAPAQVYTMPSAAPVAPSSGIPLWVWGIGAAVVVIGGVALAFGGKSRA